ncbi:MAG: hypothetical protein H6Q19_1719 [Bacteroidetes bacterium]|nr:hypothetical protein [Bacteroidota bacterium]
MKLNTTVLKKRLKILTLILFTSASMALYAQETPSLQKGKFSYSAVMERVIADGDTLYVDYIREVYIYPPMVFTSKNQEKFYWRTVRDVKKALPYARLVSYEITHVNAELIKLSTDGERKKYISQYKKEAFRKYEKDLRKLTVNQGKMLMKLIDREYEVNTYDLVKGYLGSVPAFFWNSVASLFGSTLRQDYDGKDKDRIVERVVTLVDSGQL